MAGQFAGVTTFSFEVSDGGVHGDFLVGKCVQCNSSDIDRGSGQVLGRLCGRQGGEVRNGNIWYGIDFRRCFDYKGIRSLGSFQIILEVTNGLF